MDAGTRCRDHAGSCCQAVAACCTCELRPAAEPVCGAAASCPTCWWWSAVAAGRRPAQRQRRLPCRGACSPAGRCLQQQVWAASSPGAADAGRSCSRPRCATQGGDGPAALRPASARGGWAAGAGRCEGVGAAAQPHAAQAARGAARAVAGWVPRCSHQRCSWHARSSCSGRKQGAQRCLCCTRLSAERPQRAGFSLLRSSGGAVAC